jgi:hypothetical protein
MSATKVAKRGFYEKSVDAVWLLETVGRSFLTGYRHAVGSPTISHAQAQLEAVPRRFRGFAYEGAAMGYAILDGLGLSGRNHQLPTFLAGPGDRHIYMAYVGVGWAFARLPRWRWRKVSPSDGLLGWLALDGYGFHQAYFHTRKYVYERYRVPEAGWPIGFDPGYIPRAVDQGIGRALWFVEGTDVDRVADRIGTFPAHRQAELWSGAALAVTYAGGAGESELRRFRELAGEHRPQLTLGSAFAAEARVRAGLVAEHTRLATAVLCGMSPPDAAAVTIETRAGLPADGAVPAYQVWRERTAHQFISLGRC